jgi:hypothetical protein
MGMLPGGRPWPLLSILPANTRKDKVMTDFATTRRRCRSRVALNTSSSGHKKTRRNRAQVNNTPEKKYFRVWGKPETSRLVRHSGFYWRQIILAERLTLYAVPVVPPALHHATGITRDNHAWTTVFTPDFIADHIDHCRLRYQG